MSEDLINTKVNAPTEASSEATPKRTPRLALKKKSLAGPSMKSDFSNEQEETKSVQPEMEEICPMSNCGRKFISSIKLKRHMEMRHMNESLEKKKPE